MSTQLKKQVSIQDIVKQNNKSNTYNLLSIGIMTGCALIYFFKKNKKPVSPIEGDKKQVFSVSCEFQGILSDVSYPFSFGYGSQSSGSFGYSIPFNYRLSGYTLICDSLDVNPSVVVEIESVPDDNSGIVSIVNKTLDSSKKLKELFPSALVHKSGLINIKIVSVSGCADELARYRFVLFLKSDVVL